MHMANELLSVPVAAGSFAASAVCIGMICRKAKNKIDPEKHSLMGIMGAFVFAAQMVNFQLPFMPGTSGHMVGAVLLAILLGPYAATIVMTSVVVIQCLIFQDGGLLAIGCNIINMAIVPSFIGFYLYRTIIGNKENQLRMYVSSVIACIGALTISAVLVPIQSALSGVLMVPFSTFLVTMIGVHLLIGTIEGILTAAVLIYLRQARPQLIDSCITSPAKISKTGVYVSLLVMTLIVGCGVSLYASEMPDGLEWSYAERPDQPEFKHIISNDSKTVAVTDQLQSKYSLLPDYTIRASSGEVQGDGWTSFAAVAGSGLTMGAVWLFSLFIRRNGDNYASCEN
ncbi:MAG: energy-coupling factor ABC transporter permease [Planctomycetes bacterium]|nr:energy-coupling factor ABC transporter permease [Planctomycetota bacterium]